MTPHRNRSIKGWHRQSPIAKCCWHAAWERARTRVCGSPASLRLSRTSEESKKQSVHTSLAGWLIIRSDCTDCGAPRSNHLSGMTTMTIDELSRADLLKLVRLYAKNWLAHDGCWFLAPRRSSAWRRRSSWMQIRGRASPPLKRGASWRRLIFARQVGRMDGQDFLP